MTETTAMNTLPNEILYKIQYYLDPVSYIRLSESGKCGFFKCSKQYAEKQNIYLERIRREKVYHLKLKLYNRGKQVKNVNMDLLAVLTQNEMFDEIFEQIVDTGANDINVDDLMTNTLVDKLIDYFN